MAVSSLMQYTKSWALFLKNNYPNFSQAVWTWTVWDNIGELTTIKEDNVYRWNEYNDIFKTIYSLQISQFSIHQVNADSLATTTDWNKILTEFNNNPDKNYILSFWWIEEVKKNIWVTTWHVDSYIWHTVIPYKVEWNKIYFWDNNYRLNCKKCVAEMIKFSHIREIKLV